ncbi:MAG: hypothetical protein AB7O59_05920 [Pirellulales bacterium]
MTYASRQITLTDCRLRSVACALLCLSAAGCAAPLQSSLANFRDRREIEELAADNSFPTAAEAGLPSADKKSDEG